MYKNTDQPPASVFQRQTNVNKQNRLKDEINIRHDKRIKNNNRGQTKSNYREVNNLKLTMAPRKKILRLCGQKLAGIEEIPSQLPKEEVKKEEDGEKLESSMRNMSMEDIFANEADDVFLESNPGAPIKDISTDEASPPRAEEMPVLVSDEADMLYKAIRGAQEEVSNHAKVAMGSINRNLMDVEQRSLRVMRKEQEIAARERDLQRREDIMRMRCNARREERRKAREVPTSWELRTPPRQGPARGPGFFSRGKRSARRGRSKVGLLPVENKKGFKSWLFVDDAAMQMVPGGTNDDYRIVDYEVAEPWLKQGYNKVKGLHKSQPWSTWRKAEGDSSDENDWRFDNPERKRGRRRGRARGRKLNLRPRETCNDPDQMFSNMQNDRKDDEDDRGQCRGVYIRQNVNVG